MKKIAFLFRVAVVATAFVCALQAVASFRPTTEAHGEEREEMRGVWVASVWNLDYPASPSVQRQTLEEELATLMEDAKQTGFNTVFLQVRPAADALYPSALFPWSKYLTGEQGRAPEDGFDPLACAVEQAHARGLALYAWVNPYRVTASANDNALLCADSPAVRHPEWVVTHTDGKLYLDPGIPDVQRLVADGVREILERYAVDGIQLDDYFYPGTDFADETTYATYGAGFESIDDWRRNNVDELVRTLHALTQEANVPLSVSPSGIWANRKHNPLGSDTAGMESYYTIYADSRGWVKKGYVDYIMPQIYWNFGLSVADFQTVLSWWADVTKGSGVRLCPALAAYKQAEAAPTDGVWFGENGVSQLRNQIALLRRTEGTAGFSMYAYSSFRQSPALETMMRQASVCRDRFADMQQYAWAAEAVDALAAKEIINGVSQTEFDPARPVSRADFTLMLTRLTGKEAHSAEQFADVAPEKYYAREIATARALGIATGVGNNLFCPEGLVTRQDMALMLYRYLQTEGKLAPPAEDVLSRFADAQHIAPYAREAMEAMVGAGLLGGDGETLRPADNATRAEAAVLLWRIME